MVGTGSGGWRVREHMGREGGGGRGREGVTPAAAAGGSAFISRPDQAANLGFDGSGVRGSIPAGLTHLKWDHRP